MKKLLYLLIALPFALLGTSCSNDLPDVNVDMTFSNAAKDGSTIYAVQTDTIPLTIDGFKVTSTDGKAATIANITYGWDGLPAPQLTFSNLPMEINLQNQKVGTHVLQMSATILEVDKSMAYSYMEIPVKVVASPEDLPDGLTLGTVTYSMQVGQKDK